LHVSSVGLGTILRHFATLVQPLSLSRVAHPAEGVNGERRRHGATAPGPLRLAAGSALPRPQAASGRSAPEQDREHGGQCG
jgi:hypothetical protein